MDKTYIGDGVYVSFDGFGVVLTTEDGYQTTNTIYLDPSVWVDLESYVHSLKEKK